MESWVRKVTFGLVVLCAMVATLLCETARKATVPALAKVVTADGRLIIGELKEGMAEGVKLFDIRSGKQTTLDKSEVSKLEREVPADEAIRWVGLPSYLAWRLGAVQEVTPTGRVVTAAPGSVYVNLGEGSGIEVADRLEVSRAGEMLTDPDSGEELGQVEIAIAEFKVTEVRGRFCKAVPIGEVASEVARGDVARLASPRKAVAVLPIQAGAEEDAEAARMLEQQWTTKLVERGVPVVERAELARVIVELDLQQTDLVAPGTAARVGKLVGAYAILMGTLGETVRGRVEVHARLVDVRTGELLVAASESIPVPEKAPTVVQVPVPVPVPVLAVVEAEPALVEAPSLEAALLTRVSLRPPYGDGAETEKISVQSAVMAILKQAGLNYDWGASFENTDPICRRFITPRIESVPCYKALQRILEPNGLTYRLRNRTVILRREGDD